MVLVVTSVAAYATVGGYYGGQLWHAQEAMATFFDSFGTHKRLWLHFVIVLVTAVLRNASC